MKSGYVVLVCFKQDVYEMCLFSFERQSRAHGIRIQHAVIRSASVELGGGNCGLLKRVSEAAVPSILLLLSFKLGCCASCSFGLGSGWHLFERRYISASHVTKVNYNPPCHAVFGHCWEEFLYQYGYTVCACHRYTHASKYV